MKTSKRLTMMNGIRRAFGDIKEHIDEFTEEETSHIHSSCFAILQDRHIKEREDHMPAQHYDIELHSEDLKSIGAYRAPTNRFVVCKNSQCGLPRETSPCTCFAEGLPHTKGVMIDCRPLRLFPVECNEKPDKKEILKKLKSYFDYRENIIEKTGGRHAIYRYVRYVRVLINVRAGVVDTKDLVVAEVAIYSFYLDKEPMKMKETP